MAPGWQTAPRPTLCDLYQLSAPNTGRSPVVHSGLSQNQSAPSRAWNHVWLAAGENQSMDPCPAAGFADGDAPIRGCAESLAARSGPATRHARHGGGRGSCPPFCHDGTERRIPRPKDADEQKSCYSGKKKYHTVKNILLINAALLILFLSDTYEGSVHDKRIADSTRYPLPPGSRLLQDLGFLAFTLDKVEIIMPEKKPRGKSLTDEQKANNQQIARRRVRIEHVNSSVKRCRIVKDTIRMFRDGARDMVAEVSCALHNFRVRLSPWEPMI